METAAPHDDKSGEEDDGIPRRSHVLLRTVEDLAWMKDTSGRFLLTNRRHFASRSPLDSEGVLGLTDYDVYPKNLAEQFRRDDDIVMRTLQMRTVEERLLDGDGHVHWLETIKYPLIGKGGRLLGTVGTARDITMRKLDAMSLEASNAALTRLSEHRTQALERVQEKVLRQERLAELGQRIGGIVHQVRNPLGSILNASALLRRLVSLDSPTDPGQLLELIRIIDEEAQRASSVVSGLLDFSRVTSLSTAPTDLRQLVKRLPETVPPPEGVNLSLSLQEVPILNLDAPLIQSALENLLVNAFEATTEGGSVTVQLQRLEDEVLLAVEDTGPGIAPHMQERLFEPLQTTKPTGTGLGLATARRLIEIHRGSLRHVQRERGARFEIRFPIEAPGGFRGADMA